MWIIKMRKIKGLFLKRLKQSFIHFQRQKMANGKKFHVSPADEKAESNRWNEIILNIWEFFRKKCVWLHKSFKFSEIFEDEKVERFNVSKMCASFWALKFKVNEVKKGIWVSFNSYHIIPWILCYDWKSINGIYFCQLLWNQ